MIEITTYRPELEARFIELNTEWINTHFKIEEHDREAFSDVKGHVLAGGGEIFFALDAGEAVGCCALIHHAEGNALGEWELAKMAVSSKYRGRGIGNLLMSALIAEAERRKIDAIYLEGNTRLAASIAMYRKFGFREVPLNRQNYERVDIVMEWRRDAQEKNEGTRRADTQDTIVPNAAANAVNEDR